jgi:hypothetical protein
MKKSIINKIACTGGSNSAEKEISDTINITNTVIASSVLP